MKKQALFGSLVAAVREDGVGGVGRQGVPSPLAALVEYDPNATVDGNAQSMQEALGRVRTGEVTQAVRNASVDGGRVRQGDWLALGRDGVVGSASSAADACCKRLQALVDDHREIGTGLVGC